MITRAKWLVTCAVCLAVGAVGGHLVRPRVVTVTKEVEKEVAVVHQVEVERPYTEYRDRTTTKTVYRDGPVQTVTVVEENKRKDSGGSETTTDGTTVVEKTRSTTSSPEGRWMVRALGSVDTRGTVAAGAGVEYRLVGPLVVGGWATVPIAGAPGAVTVGASVGLRF